MNTQQINGLSPEEAIFLLAALLDYRAGNTMQPEQGYNPATTPAFQPTTAAGEMIADQINGDDRDAAGVPYNPRFHSENKSKTEKGLWRARRNMTDGEKEAAKAYAEQFASVGTVPVHPQAAPQPYAPPPAQTWAPPAQQFAPPAPQLPAGPVPVDYGRWHQAFSSLYQDGRGHLTAQHIAEMNQASAITQMAEYAQSQHARNVSYDYMSRFAAHLGLQLAA